jgi:hypothetical protein
MNEVCKQLLEMIEVVNVDNQAVLAEYVQCDLVDLGDSPREY